MCGCINFCHLRHQTKTQLPAPLHPDVEAFDADYCLDWSTDVKIKPSAERRHELAVCGCFIKTYLTHGSRLLYEINLTVLFVTDSYFLSMFIVQ